MAKNTIKMTLSDNGYKNFKIVMKKMKFSDEDMFLRYCVLHAAKAVANDKQIEEIIREMKLLKDK
jgi:hypothetical protein